MRKARLLFRSKHIYPGGEIVEMKGWDVPKSPRTPEGYKYSLVYIDTSGERILGYDNAEGKGHHRHARGKEESIKFESVEKLVTEFLKEVQEIRENTHEN